MTFQEQLLSSYWKTGQHGPYCFFSDQESAILESYPHFHDQKPVSTVAITRAIPHLLQFTPAKQLSHPLPSDTPKAGD